MKKILFCFINIFALICLTGCNASDEASDNMFLSLQKEEIVEKDFKFIEKITSVSLMTDHLPQRKTFYIYTDDNNNYIGINYSSCNGDYSCDTDYKVSIYDISLNDDEIVYIDDPSVDIEHYYVNNGKYSENINYDLSLKNEYHATEKNPLVGKNYFEFELVK